jgi:NitT/TauT family transport system substrate-binding protein
MIGLCVRTASAVNATLFAVATKLGCFKQEGTEVELVMFPGSTDCVKNVATKEVLFATPSAEPLAIGRRQGMKAKVFYTAYQGNIHGIAVPADSRIQKIEDLRGKAIGVISMSSAGVIVPRVPAAAHGLDLRTTSPSWWPAKAPSRRRCCAVSRSTR